MYRLGLSVQVRAIGLGLQTGNGFFFFFFVYFVSVPDCIVQKVKTASSIITSELQPK